MDLEEEAWVKEQEKLFAKQEEREEQRREEERMRQDQIRQQQHQQQYDLEQVVRQEAEQARLLLAHQQQQQQEQLLLQSQQHQHSQMQSVAQQLDHLQIQSHRDRDLISQYEQRLLWMNGEMERLQQSHGLGHEVERNKLQEDLGQWKTKYEALAKLYAQLRKEHLDLLQKYKSVKDGMGRVSEESQSRLLQLEREMKEKKKEMMDIQVEKNSMKKEIDLVREQGEREVIRVKEELDATKHALTSLSTSQGSQINDLIARFTSDQRKMEEVLGGREKEVNRLTLLLGDSLSQTHRMKGDHEEEIMVLQTTLDQALGILKQHQDEATSGMGVRDERIGVLESRHQILLSHMMGRRRR